MNVFLAVLVVAGFAGAIEYLALPKRAQEVVQRGSDCLNVLRDASLSDEAKERTLQEHARRLFVLLGLLAGGSVLGLSLPLVGVWGLEHVGIASLRSVLAVLQRLDFLAATVVAGGLGYLLLRQTQGSTKGSGRYSWHDRLLYRVAFRTGTAQHALADVEETLYQDELEDMHAPVFITALPRSGTTMLLKLLAQTESFASHTYQDMPFLLCPMLWGRFSDRFAGDDAPRERMHGDGIQVSWKSPEAFEERIWKHFWPEHYRERHIRPWNREDVNGEFDDFLCAHMRKIVALRCEDETSDVRYVSKNNLNIARLASPPAPLREGTFLVPFRDPLQQAASMLRQHRRFLCIHEKDDFVREYMEAIGHHEFGEGLRPVNFADWLEDAPSPNDLAFWVRYWIAAYEHVLAHAGSGVVLASYAHLTHEPEASLARLANVLEVPVDELVPQAGRLHPARTHSVNETGLSEAILRDASEVYEQLNRTAEV